MQHTKWDLKKKLALELCSLFQTHWDHQVYRMNRRNIHKPSERILCHVSSLPRLPLPPHCKQSRSHMPVSPGKANNTPGEATHAMSCREVKGLSPIELLSQACGWWIPQQRTLPVPQPGTWWNLFHLVPQNLIPGTLAVSKPPEPSIPFVKGSQCLNAFRNRPGQATPKAYRCWGKSKI